MTRLPVLHPKEVVAALVRAGFEVHHQTGSHVILRQPVTRRRTVVAVHARDLPRQHLKTILKQAGMTEAEFRQFL